MKLEVFLEKLAEIINSGRKPKRKKLAFNIGTVRSYQIKSKILQWIFIGFNAEVSKNPLHKTGPRKETIGSIDVDVYSILLPSKQFLHQGYEIEIVLRIFIYDHTVQTQWIATKKDLTYKTEKKLSNILGEMYSLGFFHKNTKWANITYPFFDQNEFYSFQEFLDILDKQYLAPKEKE